jgi:predicted Zn finger-like uncharacterized protein
MILTCPNCGTQYVVKDGAIPPQGRQVRCANCKHSWHQDPETAEASAEADDETIAEATVIDPRSGPEAEERAYEEAAIEQAQEETAPEAVAEEPAQAESESTGTAEIASAPTDWDAPPQAEAQDDAFSPFPMRENEAQPRRRGVLLTLIVTVIVVAALAAAFWFLAPPEWKARIGLGVASASPLALVTTHMDRQRLQSGNELLTVTGRVINPTTTDQQVPPLQAQLRSRSGKVVYSWTIAPPARTLPPGASASFNSAEVNVPPGGDELTISLGAPRA